jgi:flavodoxin
MKILVTYSSLTGNTKKVAKAINEIMPEGTDLAPVESAPAPDNYDLIALGFWVNRETADNLAQGYMEKISGKKVALFATLGAYPDSEHALKSMENASALLTPRNEVIGSFICQGKIDPALTERLKKLGPDHPHGMTPERLQRHEDAARHPNEEDFANAKRVFAEIVNSCK